MIGIAAIAAIAWFLLRHRTEIGRLFSIAGLRWFALGGVVFVMSHPLVASGFHFVHRAIGIQGRWSSAIDSYLRRLPARYVPGGIWHSLSRYLDLHSEFDVRGRALFGVYVFENGIVALAGLGVALAAAAWIGGNEPLAPLRWPIAAALAVVLATLGVFATVSKTRIAWTPLALALALNLGNWIWLTLAFTLYAKGLGDPALASCGDDLSLGYLIATVTGFIAFFAPQGWGVAESVFAMLRPCGAPIAVAVAALTGFRIVCLIADSGLFALWWGVSRLRARNAG